MLMLSELLSLITNRIYSRQPEQMRLSVSMDFSDFITGSEEVIQANKAIESNIRDIFTAIEGHAVKVDAVVSGSFEEQTRQMQSYAGVVSSVQTAIRDFAGTTTTAYDRINSAVQESIKTGATRLLFDVEGAKVEVDLYGQIVRKFLNTLGIIRTALDKETITAREAVKPIYDLRQAFEKALPPEIATNLKSLQASLAATGENTEKATARIIDLERAVKTIRKKDVTYRFKIDPEGMEHLNVIQDRLVKIGDVFEDTTDEAEKFADVLEESTRELIRQGLNPLADRFKQLESTIREGVGIGRVSDKIAELGQQMRAGNITLAEAAAGMSTLASSTVLTDRRFDTLRESVSETSEALQRQARLIDAIARIKQVISNPALQSVDAMQKELQQLQTQFADIKGFNQFNQQLSLLIDSVGKHKDIDAFRERIVALTSIDTENVEELADAVEKVGESAKQQTTHIAGTVEELRKFGISKGSITSLDQAAEKLRSINVAARKKEDIENYAKAVDKTAKSVSKATVGSKKFLSNLGKINVTTGRMGKIFSILDARMSQLLIRFGVWGVLTNTLRQVTRLITSVSRGIYELTKQAAKLEDVSTAFRVLASQTTSAELALAQVRSAAGGVIDEFDLMSAATRAAIAGLPVERIDDFMRGARALGPLVGRDIPEAFDRLTNAAIKQERRLLDELGIVIRAEDAYKDYATAHHTTVAALVATEKQAAFTSAILASVDEKIIRLGGNLDQAQGPFLRFEAAWKDLGITVGEWLDQTFQVSEAILSITELMHDLSASLSDVDKQSATLGASALDAFESYKKYGDEAEGLVPILIADAERQIKITNDVNASLASQADAQERVKEITLTLGRLFPELARTLEDDLVDGLSAVRIEADATTAAFNKLYAIRSQKAIAATIKNYADASGSVAAFTEKLKLAREARAVLISDGKISSVAVEKEIKQRTTLAMIIGGVNAQYDISAKLASARIAQSVTELTTIEANVKLIERQNAALLEQQVRVTENRNALDAYLQTQVAVGTITKENLDQTIELTTALKQYTTTLDEVSIGSYVQMKASEELRSSYIKVRIALGLTNEELVEQIDLISKLIAEWGKIDKVDKAWETIFKTFETSVKGIAAASKFVEPLDLRLAPSKRAQMELDVAVTRYENMFKLLQSGMEYTTAANEDAGQSLSSLLSSYEHHYAALHAGEVNQAQFIRDGIDAAIDRYKLDEKNILSLINLKKEQGDKEIALNKRIITEATTTTETKIANIKEETADQIRMHQRIVTAWKDVYAVLSEQDVLYYDDRIRLRKKIDDAEVALAKARRKHLDDEIKAVADANVAFASEFGSIINKIYGANRDTVIDILKEIQELGIKTMDLDIKPGAIDATELIRAFKAVQEQVAKEMPEGPVAIDLKKLQIPAAAAVTGVLQTLQEVSEGSEEINKDMVRDMEKALMEYILEVRAVFSELAKTNKKYNAEIKKLDAASATIRRNSLKRQLSDEKTRLSFISDVNNDIVKIENATSVKKINIIRDRLKGEFGDLKESLRGDAELRVAMRSAQLKADEQIDQIRFDTTEEYQGKIERATRVAQLQKIKADFEAEDISQRQKIGLLNQFQNTLVSVLSKERDIIKDHIRKRNAIEEMGAIEREEIASNEVREKLDKQLEALDKAGKEEVAEREAINNLIIANEISTAENIERVITSASRKRRMEHLKLQKGLADNEQELALLTIDASTEAFENSNRLLESFAGAKAKEHSATLDSMREETATTDEELDRQLSLVNSFLNLETLAKQNADRAQILSEELKAEAIRAIREKEHKKFLTQLTKFQRVLEDFSKVRLEISKTLVREQANEQREGLEKAKEHEIREVMTSFNLKEASEKKLLDIDAKYNELEVELAKETANTILQITRDYNTAVFAEHTKGLTDLADFISRINDQVLEDDTVALQARQDRAAQFWSTQSTETANSADAIRQTQQQLADDLYSLSMDSTERLKVVVGESLNAFDALNKAAMAAMKKDFAGVLLNLHEFTESIFDIFDDATERMEEAEKRAREAVKAQLSKWRQVGSEIGSALAQGISEEFMKGTELDFEEIFKQALRTEVINTIAAVAADALGPAMKKIRDSLTAIAGRGEAFDILAEEHAAEVDKQIETATRILATSPFPVAEDLSKFFSSEVYETIIKPWQTGVKPEDIQKAWIKSKYSTKTLAEGITDANELAADVIPQLQDLPDLVGNIYDIFEESERSVGLRTMRAITEPQANQIIVLLGRQVDHLATIASNTSTLVHGLPKLAPAISDGIADSIDEKLPRPAPAMTPGMVDDIKSLKAGGIPSEVTATPAFTTLEETSHKEDVNITITINGRTEQIENGMLVDSVIPILAAEESRLKMRREKAIGRRRVLG